VPVELVPGTPFGAGPVAQVVVPFQGHLASACYLFVLTNGNAPADPTCSPGFTSRLLSVGGAVSCGTSVAMVPQACTSLAGGGLACSPSAAALMQFSVCVPFSGPNQYVVVLQTWWASQQGMTFCLQHGAAGPVYCKCPTPSLLDPANLGAPLQHPLLTVWRHARFHLFLVCMPRGQDKAWHQQNTKCGGEGNTDLGSCTQPDKGTENGSPKRAVKT